MSEDATPLPRAPKIDPDDRLVIDAWFVTGCGSKRAAITLSGRTKSTSPARIWGKKDVQAYIEWKQEQVSHRWAVTEERIIAEYAKIAFASVGDLMEVQADGSAWLDMAAMTDDHRAALAEFSSETYPEKDGDALIPVKRSKVKFHSKQAALDALAKIKGMFKEKVEVSGAVSFVDRVAKAREMLAKKED